MDLQNQLRELFLRHGPSPVVKSFIQQEHHHLDLTGLLEETFRRIDLGPRETVCRQGAYVSLEVELLLRQGAFIHPERCNTLLEDTYRNIELGPLEFKRRAGICLSPEVEFFLIQGAFFEEVPCGLTQLVEATTEYLQQSDQNKENFLFQQVMHDIIHHHWYYFLDDVYESLLKSVDSETLCHIVRLISRQQDELKIYTVPFMRLTFSTRRFQMNKANLIDASIRELRRRLGELDEVTIRAQGRKINALSPLLQARSTYFKKLISYNSKKTSFGYEGLYETIRFVVIYAHSSELTDPFLWDEFAPYGDRDTTEKTLNKLINILHAANTFEMADLFGAVEQHIVIYGESFIRNNNAQEIKYIAKEANAGFLERYCDAFIATNLRTSTLFPSLPVELRLIIWRQVASQPRLVEVTWPENRRKLRLT